MSKKKNLKSLGLTKEEIEIIEAAEAKDDGSLEFTEDDNYQMGHHIINYISTDKALALAVNDATDDVIMDKGISQKTATGLMRALEDAIRNVVRQKS